MTPGSMSVSSRTRQPRASVSAVSFRTMTKVCAIGVAISLMATPHLGHADPPPPAWYIYEGSVATVCAGFSAYFALRPGTHAEKDYDQVMATAFAVSGGLISATMLTV